MRRRQRNCYASASQRAFWLEAFSFPDIRELPTIWICGAYFNLINTARCHAPKAIIRFKAKAALRPFRGHTFGIVGRPFFCDPSRQSPCSVVVKPSDNPLEVSDDISFQFSDHRLVLLDIKAVSTITPEGFQCDAALIVVFKKIAKERPRAGRGLFLEQMALRRQLEHQSTQSTLRGPAAAVRLHPIVPQWRSSTR